MTDVFSHYEIKQSWVYCPGVDRMVVVSLWERINPDPTGEILQYMITVEHDGIEVKRISFDKFHITMFTFKKIIDTEVRHHEQSGIFSPINVSEKA